MTSLKCRAQHAATALLIQAIWTHTLPPPWELAMGNLLFWLGIGAAQKTAGSKSIEHRHWVASLIVGILGALLIAGGMFLLLVAHEQ